MHKSPRFYIVLGVIVLILRISNSSAQDPTSGNTHHTKWIELGFGLIGDLAVKVMNFPAYSINLEGHYKVKPVILSLKFCYSKEIVMAADYGPGAKVLDGGILVGRYLSGGASGKRKILLSGGLGLLRINHFIGTGPYSFQENKIITIGFPLEAKIFWVKKRFGWGFSLNGNINPEFSYLGGSLNFVLGSL